MNAIPSSFRGDLKKSARVVCAEEYKLDEKFFDNDPDLELLEGGGDPRVAERAQELLGPSMPFLDGPCDSNVRSIQCFQVSISLSGI